MKFVLHPWQLLLFIISGWVNREQRQAIDYLRTEDGVLREKLGKKRISLSDDQRRRVSVKGKVLGRRMLEETAYGQNTRPNDKRLSVRGLPRRWNDLFGR